MGWVVQAEQSARSQEDAHSGGWSANRASDDQWLSGLVVLIECASLGTVQQRVEGSDRPERPCLPCFACKTHASAQSLEEAATSYDTHAGDRGQKQIHTM